MLGYVFGIALGYLLIERAFPGWRLPPVRTWPLRAVAMNAVQLGVVLLAGITWEKWLMSASLLRLEDHLPTPAAGFFAYLASTFVFYWWHRWRHESDWLWTHFHQIHHSAQRIEVLTTFYKHPGEMIVNSLINSALVFFLFGLTLEGSAIYIGCTVLAEFFYHANVRTPRWVGYLVQRPEMHRIHHQYGYHRSNYSDIVWWDILFGTYENPADVDVRCGFDDEKEQRLGDMLLGRDVHQAG